jgi:hypothetical protein
MRLYVCWGLFRTPRPGHPCRNAFDTLIAAGWTPEVIRCYGWGLLPRPLNRSKGRRRVRAMTGGDWVPVLEIDDRVISGSKRIAQWAKENPAGASCTRGLTPAAPASAMRDG